MSYEVRLTPPARRALTQQLPEAVAAAAWEFIDGPLRDNPQRVGKPLLEPFVDQWSARRGTYRILYKIDDKAEVVIITDIRHRATAYRPH